MLGEKARRRQRGSVAVIVGVGLVALAGAAALAVDYGFLQYKRSQLQTAADTAALAGAQVLLGYGTDFNKTKDTAVAFGQKNLSGDDAPNSALTRTDVKMYDSLTNAEDNVSPDQVEVTVARETGRGNPVDLFLAPIIGKKVADVSATARAGLFCAEGSNCLKPWAPPAKFAWDDSCDANKKYKDNGKLDYESACEVESVTVSGYGSADLGAQITLKYDDAQENSVESHYNPVAYPPVNKGDPNTGGDEYRDNIAGCSDNNNISVVVGDDLALLTGDKVGPTKQGIDELIAQDPGAYWDSATKSVKGSAYDDPMDSPRVALLPFYDPSLPQKNGQGQIKVYQLGAVFIEGVNGKAEVTGRFIRAMAEGAVRKTGNCDTTDFGLYGSSMALDSSRQ